MERLDRCKHDQAHSGANWHGMNLLASTQALASWIPESFQNKILKKFELHRLSALWASTLGSEDSVDSEST